MKTTPTATSQHPADRNPTPPDYHPAAIFDLREPPILLTLLSPWQQKGSDTGPGVPGGMGVPGGSSGGRKVGACEELRRLRNRPEGRACLCSSLFLRGLSQRLVMSLVAGGNTSYR